MKICAKCKQTKGTEHFHKNKRTKDGLQKYCKECNISQNRTHYHNNREARIQHVIKYNSQPQILLKRRLRKYNITLEQFTEMLTDQKEECAICRTGDKALYIDHCHSSGQVRGLLCSNCNTALGLLKDSTVNLEKAIIYLQQFTVRRGDEVRTD